MNFPLLLLFFTIVPVQSDEQSAPKICDVTIIGAGAGGTYAAYLLSKRYRNRLCLIEKESHVGGRTLDVSEFPGGPRYGMGALRIMSNQKTLVDLAYKLGIPLERKKNFDELYKARGRLYLRNKFEKKSAFDQMCRKSYPDLNCTNPLGMDSASHSWYKLIKTYAESRVKVDISFANFQSYVRATLGDEGYQFLQATWPTRSFFSDISTGSTLAALLKYDTTVETPEPLFPIGGMQKFAEKLADNAAKNGAKLHFNNPVISVESVEHSGIFKFKITSKSEEFFSRKLILALPPDQIAEINGPIIEAIKNHSEFKSILPVKVASIQTWWRTRWWEEVKNFRNLSRVVSHDNCFLVFEIPTNPYAAAQNVTRAVFDDGICLETWESLLKGPKRLLEDEIVRGLQNVFKGIKVPRPRHTKGIIWPNGWHFLKPKFGFTNAQILKWSAKPLPDYHVYLVNEAFNIDFSGWIDAAVKSAMHILKRNFKIKFPCLCDDGSPAICGEDMCARRNAAEKNVQMQKQMKPRFRV